MKESTLEKQKSNPIPNRIIEELYERYADMIYRLVLVRTKSTQDSDDILQEVFLRCLKSGSIFEDSERQKAWFIRAAINCSNSYFTSAWRRRTVPTEDITFGETNEDKELYRLVLSLPPKYSAAIHLYYYEGYSVNEIADMMSSNASTVKSWLKRARETLKKYIKEGDFDV
ncbi:MAG: sigma-70 family RNA polymerase sigma factor [Oscillospiraceae bacterium]|nr:sigma-70 family RNA polymerase sigma factor [Oscillospiraceae bacterium]